MPPRLHTRLSFCQRWSTCINDHASPSRHTIFIVRVYSKARRVHHQRKEKRHSVELWNWRDSKRFHPHRHNSHSRIQSIRSVDAIDIGIPRPRSREKHSIRQGGPNILTPYSPFGPCHCRYLLSALLGGNLVLRSIHHAAKTIV